MAAVALVPIKLGGASFLMRPAWEVYRDVEAETDMTIKELTLLVMNRRITLKEASIIVFYGTRAGGGKVDALDAVMQRIFEITLEDVDLRTSLMKFLLSLQYTPEEAVKKFNAEVVDLLEAQAQTI